MNSPSINNRRKNRMIILMVINSILVFAASYMGLFKGNQKYVWGTVSVLLTATLIILSLRYRIVKRETFIVYGIVAAGLILFQFI